MTHIVQCFSCTHHNRNYRALSVSPAHAPTRGLPDAVKEFEKSNVLA